MSDQTLASMTLDGYLEALASKAPTPGGGAVGAISSATAASLIAMVGAAHGGQGRVRGPGGSDADDDRHGGRGPGGRSWSSPTGTRTRSTAVMVAFKMPKDTDEEQDRALGRDPGRLRRTPPRCRWRSRGASVDLMELAEDATAMGNPQAASDGLSGAAHLYCAALCAIANVEINAASLKDERARASMLDEVASLTGRADQSVREPPDRVPAASFVLTGPAA